VSRTGPSNARVWSFAATNPSSGTADATQITGLSLLQVSGRSCRPTIKPPSAFPVVLGDIAATSKVTAAFTIDFGRCSSDAQFAVVMPWSSSKYETGTFVLEHQRQ
jgi:hypothetical protein